MAGEGAQFEDGSGGGAGGARVEIFDITADHHGDDLVDGDRADLAVADRLAIAHDGEAIAECLDLLEGVADVDDGDTLGAETAHEGEEGLHVFLGEGAGGLVEDEYLAPDGDGAGDFNELLFGDGEVGDEGGGIEGGQAHFVQGAAGNGAGFTPVHERAEGGLDAE